MLVEIRTDRLNLTIKGPASHPRFPEGKLQEKEAELKGTCDDDFEIVLAQFMLECFDKMSVCQEEIVYRLALNNTCLSVNHFLT